MSVKNVYTAAETVTTHPTPTAEMNVPRKANMRMDPKLRKKLSYWQNVKVMPRTSVYECTCLSSYPEFKMIGGNNRLKNSVCLNVWKGYMSELTSIAVETAREIGKRQDIPKAVYSLQPSP